MIVDRRTLLLSGAAGLVFAGARVRLARAAARNGDALYLSARTTMEGSHGFAGFTQRGIRFETALPGRGHGCAVRPGGMEAVAFARRPGRFMVVIDPRNGRTVRRIAAAEGRHYFGHGVFSPDGALLYVTESAYDAAGGAVGAIGIYDARDGYRRIGEHAGFGIGPHEIGLLSDGRTLAVAVGGILTHPDTGRAKLNIPVMDPSLVYVDRHSGALLERHRPPPAQHRNSIRHLAIAAGDVVVAVLQYQGPPGDRPPLVMMHRRGDAARFLSAPDPVQARMRNYCGSVAVDPASQVAAVTSPQGGIVTFWSLAGRTFVGALDMPDGCGIASDEAGGGFIVTSGTGRAMAVDAAGPRAADAALPLAACRWDNHLTVAG